jgi:hypothetical protein
LNQARDLGILTDETINDELDALAPGGLTGGNEKMSGFDCSHYCDYSYNETRNKAGELLWVHEMCISQSATFKDHDFVLHHIKEMIDFLVEK